MTKKRIHLIYSILLSAALVVAGVCLMVACVGIYRSGDRPFSREAVAVAFRTVDIPVYVSLLLLLGSMLLNLLWPLENQKKPVEKQYTAMLRRLTDKVDMQYCAPHLRVAIQKQRRGRQLHKTVALVLLGLCSVGFLFYGASTRNFPMENINGAMVKAMCFFIPCLLVPFGYGVFTVYYCRHSTIKEIELFRQAISDGCPPPQSQPCPAPKKSLLPVLKTAVLVLAVGILLFGLFTGGTQDVLTKAVNICTECVGLG